MNEEAARDASDGEADELGGHDDHPLVCEGGEWGSSVKDEGNAR